MLRVELHPDAEEDLYDGMSYLEAERPGYGEILDEAVQDAEDLIARFPHSGRVIVEGIRRVQVKGFRYALIYEVRRTSILVLAVAHHSQHPDFWIGRLRRP